MINIILPARQRRECFFQLEDVTCMQVKLLFCDNVRAGREQFGDKESSGHKPRLFGTRRCAFTAQRCSRSVEPLKPIVLICFYSKYTLVRLGWWRNCGGRWHAHNIVCRSDDVCVCWGVRVTNPVITSLLGDNNAQLPAPCRIWQANNYHSNNNNGVSFDVRVHLHTASMPL